LTNPTISQSKGGVKVMTNICKKCFLEIVKDKRSYWSFTPGARERWHRACPGQRVSRPPVHAEYARAQKHTVVEFHGAHEPLDALERLAYDEQRANALKTHRT
jgi:hypothetical protein